MATNRIVAIAVAAAALLAAVPGRAEVVSSGEGHFFVRQQIVANVPAQRAWKALTEEIGRWWSPVHTWSGNSRNLSLEARPGGCFCERLPGGGVRHMEVVYVKPPELLRLEGGLGPLQEQALAGAMTWTLVADGDSCTIGLVYRVAGGVEGGLAGWAPGVDSVLELQIGRFKAWIETGNPEIQP